MSKRARFVGLSCVAFAACVNPAQQLQAPTYPVDAGASASLDCLVPPALPAPPVLPDWPCAAGWSPVAAYTLTPEELAAGAAAPVQLCEPPQLPQSCADGTRAHLGASECKTVGDACPSGEWPTSLPSGTVWYVKVGSSGAGTSAASPFGTITQALGAARAGDTIAIAKGTYPEYLGVTRAVTLLGACATQTIITGPSRASNRGTIDVAAAATISNLQVTGPRVGIWVLKNPSFATLRGVIVNRAELVGVYVSDDGHAALEDVLVTSTLPDPADGKVGRGLQVRLGGQVRGNGVTFEKNSDVSITVDGAGCNATLDDVVVRDTRSELSSHGFGRGMEVRGGAVASLTGALFERNRNSAIVMDQPGTRLTLTDVVLQDTLPQENNDTFGGGLEVATQATCNATRLLLRRNLATSVRVGKGAHFTAEDFAALHTEAQRSDDTQGLGVVSDAQAAVSLSRAVFDRNRLADLVTDGAGSTLSVTDAVLRENQPQRSDGAWGVGLIGAHATSVTLTRVRVERAADSAVFLQQQASGTISDLLVTDVGRGVGDPGTLAVGNGLALQSGATASVTRAAFDKTRSAAVVVQSGSTLTITDLTATDILANEHQRFGRALTVAEGAVASVLRAKVLRAREVAFLVATPGSTLSLTQVSIDDTQPTTTTLGEGRALSVESGSSATATCLLAQRSREVAVYAAGTNTTLSLRGARVVDTTGVMGFADGILARDGPTMVLEDCEVSRSQSLGIGYSNAQGSITRAVVTDNGVGLFVGDGASLSATPGALQVQVDDATVVDGNRIDVSSVSLPLPSSLGAQPARTPY